MNNAVLTGADLSGVNFRHALS
ncbi:pentapeptide repeat-containing protein [Methylicorpusculum sp.]